MDTIERIRLFTAHGDTAEGRIIAQIALSEIERLRTNVEYWRLAAERRDARKERSGLDIPEAQTLGEVRTVSEFSNELGNSIRITIEGPTSKSTNDLTLGETSKLNETLTSHFSTLGQRVCTCHPDDSPPTPCPQKFAVTDCRVASLNTARIAAAGRIIDIMSGGNLDWRTRINDSDFLESADWLCALSYADAALSQGAPRSGGECGSILYVVGETVEHFTP